MKTFIKKEWPLLLIVAAPGIYLWSIWNSLPEQVPMHYNASGEADRYGNKSELILIAFLLPVLIYVIMLAVPYIDPKKRMQLMGAKYTNLKAIMTVFMSGLAIFIIHQAGDATQLKVNLLLFGIGILYAALGNYFKTIRPNYFVGIKTPWTLENETVWKDTHKMAGKYWVGGGVLIMISSLMLDHKSNMIVFLVVTSLIALIPVVYSYRRFQRVKEV